MTDRRTVLLCGGLLLGNSVLWGQGVRESSTEVVIRGQTVAISRGADEGMFDFVSSELMLDGKTVKNAPYSADAVTETTQVLADGNRIVRKNTATTHRDSEGRTRREQTLESIGPLAAAGEPAQTVFISDPVAGASYVLNPRDKTARKLEMPRLLASSKEANARVRIGAMAVGPGGEGLTEVQNALATFKATGFKATASKSEALGKQMIEGVEAEGKRVTWTIPQGQIGNQRAIQIVSEQWYSPELQALVLSKRSDPRSGETVYRLTNLRRSEPPRALFEVPADYTVREEGSVVRTIERLHRSGDK